MIRHLKFENFCSFRDSGELALTTSAKTPTDDSFADSICGDKMTVLAGVFGPNAAGKTNLLKLPAFLNFFIRHSFQHGQADGSIPVSTGLVTGRREFKEVMASLGRFETNVKRMGKAEVVQGNRTSEVVSCAEYLRDNPHFLADIEARLKAADLGISAHASKRWMR